MPNTPYPKGTAAALIAAALAEVGTVEQGDNLTKYGEYTGANGLPWCGSFVNWCANEAAVKIPSMVSTAAGAQKMKDQGRWKVLPKLGDLCFMDFPHDGVDRISHIGIVVEVALRSVLCVEGNTGNKDQRNGGMVMVKERFLGKEIVGFARPKYLEYAGEFPIVQLQKTAAKEKKK
jgi:hypothetical protein